MSTVAQIQCWLATVKEHRSLDQVKFPNSSEYKIYYYKIYSTTLQLNGSQTSADKHWDLGFPKKAVKEHKSVAELDVFTA